MTFVSNLPPNSLIELAPRFIAPSATNPALYRHGFVESC